MRHEKPELSEKNPYHLSRHRYYELKHFCFQYPEWKKNIALASGWEAHGDDIGGIVRGNIPSNPHQYLPTSYNSAQVCGSTQPM